MATPITEEKEVNEIYAVIPGDASVGIQDDLIVLKGFFYLQPEEVENVRQRFADFVAYTWGEKPRVQFDFEHQAEVEAEEDSWAEQLAYEQRIAAEYTLADRTLEADLAASAGVDLVADQTVNLAKAVESDTGAFPFMQVEDLAVFKGRRTGLGF